MTTTITNPTARQNRKKLIKKDPALMPKDKRVTHAANPNVPLANTKPKIPVTSDPGFIDKAARRARQFKKNIHQKIQNWGFMQDLKKLGQ